MRGVLQEDMLQVYAWTAAFTSPMVTVIDDGHAYPYAQSFIWPDGSPGLVIRLEEDDAEFPTLLEMTHAASGRKINLTIEPTGLLSSLIRANSSLYEEFDTIAEMLVSTGNWTQCLCNNAVAGDKYVTTWTKLPVTSELLENGNDIRTLGSGRKIMRLTVREYLEPTVVLSSTTITYNIGAVVGFPSIADARASNVDATYVIVTNEADEHKIFKKDETNDESGIDGVDWFKNALNIHYNTQ